MKKLYVSIALACYSLVAYAQPASKVYWVGPLSGATIGATGNWAGSSGGAGGAYPSNLNYQLIFDGAGTIGRTYTVNFNSTTGGYFSVTNNTTLILQGNFSSATVLNNSGYNVEAGSKIIFESIGTGTTTARCSSTAYPSEISGELQGKATGGGMTLDLMTSFGLGTTINIFGTVRLEGPKSAQLNGTPSTLVFKPASNLVLNTDVGTTFTAAFDPASTITITGAGMAGSANSTGTYLSNSGTYGDVIYDCPTQSATRPIFSGGGWSARNLTIKNTGTGVLGFLASSTTANTLTGDLTLQGSPNFKFMTSVTTSSNCTVNVNGKVDIQGGQFDLSNGGTGTGNALLFVKGNFTNAGNLKATSTGATGNQIEFNGTATQTVTPGSMSATDPISFKVNNSTGITVTSNWTLPSSTASKLTLTSGNVNMSGNLLRVQNPSTTAIVGGTLTAHIIGSLRRATNTASVVYLFPVSKSTSELATVKIYPADAIGTDYQVEYFRPNTFPANTTDLPTGIVGIGNFYWDISRPLGSASADLNFVYSGLTANGGITDAAGVRVLHWSGASPWQNFGGVDGGGGSVDVSGVTSFSPFTLGSTSQVLPLTLLNFSGDRNATTNTLRWSTTMEQQLKEFYLERSADGRMFTTVAFVQPQSINAGSTGQYFYTYTDNNIGANQYYRLKMVDQNGGARFSSIVLLKDVRTLSLLIAGLYPNPTTQAITIQLQSPFAGKIKLAVRSVVGVKVLEKIAELQKGVNAIELNTSQLSPGLYIITVKDAQSKTLQEAFIKQ